MTDQSTATERMSAVGNSDRWDCVLAVPLDGETAQALCERLARTFTKGCCYYQLLKKESISATKEGWH